MARVVDQRVILKQLRQQLRKQHKRAKSRRDFVTASAVAAKYREILVMSKLEREASSNAS